MNPSSALTADDRKLLLAALNQGRAFEANFNAEHESRFREALAACANGDSILIIKLADLAPKVSLARGAKHLMGLLVPLERLSGRAARDEEFLFNERDGLADPAGAAPSPHSRGLAMTHPRIVVCENIRSAFNVGAIFRTAEAFSASEVNLCGYTPDPQKTAMGTDTLVPSKRFDRTSDAIARAKADGFKIVALENSPGAIAIENFTWPEKTLLVLGNERFGVDSETLACCDHIVRLAATGQKNSINVGIAFGVAASRWHMITQESSLPNSSRQISPIGFLRGGFANSQVAPRQGSYRPSVSAQIELESRFEGRPSNFEQALQDLEGFERAWIVFGFHENQGWNPQVRPPRGDGSKRGLFSTRSPHRPNGLGISCVRILKVDADKRRLEISEHDLLEGTPIFDIKPYVPGADAFQNAKAGWVDAIEAAAFSVLEKVEAQNDLDWLEANGENRLRPFIDEQLRYQPLDTERKRVERFESDSSGATSNAASNLYTIAFRTWRIDFLIDESAQTIELFQLRSGYSENEIADKADPYNDKDLHRSFRARK